MKGKIAIDKQLCKGCKYCVMSCPKGVIVIEKQFNKMGYFTAHPEHMGKCTGCALCAQMCPELAIEVWAENSPRSGGLAKESRKKKVGKTRLRPMGNRA